MKYEEKYETIELSQAVYNKTQQYPFCLLVTGTGSGKTFITIRTAWMINKQAGLIVFMPKSKKVENGWKKSIEAFNTAMGADIKLFQFHYEQMRDKTQGEKEIADALQQLRHEKRDIVIAYDEAHKLKLSVSGSMNLSTKFALRLKALPDIKAHIGLAAKPLPNSYLDAGSYFVMAGFYKNVSEFLKEHIMFRDKYHRPIVKDPYTKKTGSEFFRDFKRLDKQLNDICVYMDTEHLLPNRIEKTKTYQLDNQLKMKDTTLSELLMEEIYDTRYRLYHQIPKWLREGYLESYQQAFYRHIDLLATDPFRVRAIAEIIQEIENKEPHPILIFYQFKRNYQVMKYYLEKWFPDWEIQTVNGDLKEVAQPKNPKTLILIQYIAGSAAIEFPTSKTSIFAMPPLYKYQDYKQAAGRNVRAYSTGDVVHYRIIASNTIDEKIWATIDAKGDFDESLLKLYYTID